MLTMLVYFINGSVLAYFSFKVFRSLKKKYNPYLSYFLGTAGFYSLSLFAYTFLILFSYYTKNSTYLYWSDFFGRMFLYIGSFFGVQISLYHFWPKDNRRYIASYLLAVLSAVLLVYNLILPNHPYIDKLGIIHWQAQPFLGLGLAIVFISVWIPASYVFVTEFIKSKFTSLKALFLGVGFLLGAVSGFLQDFAFSTLQYLVVNLSLALGFVLIFIGLFYEEDK